jgi:hypothetical protein
MLKSQNVKPDHLILGSEACHCPTTGYAGGDLSVAWARAERYGHTILSDLAAGSNGKLFPFFSFSKDFKNKILFFSSCYS